MQLRVLFTNNSAVVNPLFSQQLNELSNFLKEYPKTSIELHGYASKTGSSAYNLALSKRRAQSVKNVLVKNGITSNRVTFIGYGDTDLVSTGDDEASQALNRRVTATVVGFKGEPKKEWTIFTTLPKGKRD